MYSPTQKSSAPLAGTTTLYRKPRPFTRQRRAQEKQKQKRTAMPCANGFLRQTVIPVTVAGLPPDEAIQSIENSFFQSLVNLSVLYAFDPLNVHGIAFPYNIYLAHKHAAFMLKQIDSSLILIIVNDDDNTATLATVKTAESSLTLFYVPAEPLYRLIHAKTNKQVTDLLLSAFAYLCQTAGMPFFDGGFVDYNYDMILNWIVDSKDEWDAADYKEKVAEVKKVQRNAQTLKKQVSKPAHLKQFSKRVTAFRAANKTEKELIGVITRLHELFLKYPGISFMDFIGYDLLYPEIEERIEPDQYFSFYWSDKGWLCDDLMDNINVNLQEMGFSDDPVAVQRFDTPQTEGCNDLVFVTTLLDIICELADVLNQL